jgi:hypothetical protein
MALHRSLALIVILVLASAGCGPAPETEVAQAAELVAFPGAEGFGRLVQGERGGDVDSQENDQGL